VASPFQWATSPLRRSCLTNRPIARNLPGTLTLPLLGGFGCRIRLLAYLAIFWQNQCPKNGTYSGTLLRDYYCCFFAFVPLPPQSTTVTTGSRQRCTARCWKPARGRKLSLPTLDGPGGASLASQTPDGWYHAETCYLPIEWLESAIPGHGNWRSQSWRFFSTSSSKRSPGAG